MTSGFHKTGQVQLDFPIYNSLQLVLPSGYD